MTTNDDRSAINSANSQRLSTNMSGGMSGSALERASNFSMYLAKPESIQALWEAEDPNKFAQNLILSHVEEISEVSGEDWRKWDDTEDRFEGDELKWIADYVVRNLVFIKSDLCLDQPDAVSHVMQVLWKTLDLLNPEASTSLTEATQERYMQLRNGLKRLFEEGIVNKEQVGKTLEYTRKTIFGHMQLYLTCIGQKKQQRRVKRVEIFTETPQV